MKEGRKEGLQSGGAKAGCKVGLCNRADCIQVMVQGIAIGRGARRGAEVDAERRGARGGCKAVVQTRGAQRVFAMGKVARK